MQQELHIVLGAAGGVGYAVCETLRQHGLPYITVQRSSRPAYEPSRQADLLDADATMKALEGGTYVYLCTGLPYDSNIWQAQWPTVMHHVIEACLVHGSKLIFLDNMYMYSDPLPIPFDENTPQHPSAKKGKVRKEVADMLLHAVHTRNLNAVIGRAADFYGPAATNSHFYFSFLERMLLGKAPQTLFKDDVLHTFAYTRELGQAMMLLALDPHNRGEVFHLPVTEPVTIGEVVDIFNKELGTKFKPIFLNRFMVNILSLFIKPISEIREMLYQFRYDYEMSADKFLLRYPSFEPITLEQGIRDTVAYFKKQNNEIPELQATVK